MAVLLSILGSLGVYYLVVHSRDPQIVIIENEHKEIVSIEDSTNVELEELELTKFDPNKFSLDDWIELGFSSKQAKSILKFRHSIGGFKKPEELLRCYVIDSLKYFELFPFIDIQSIDKHEVENITKNINQLNSFSVYLVFSNTPMYDGFDELEELYYFRDKKGFQYFSSLSDDSISLLKPLQLAINNGFKSAIIKKVNSKQLKDISPKKIILDINSVDSIQLRTLKGIGPVLAKRIVEYRVKLGGFLKTEQLKEVYGLKKETFDNIQSNIKILDSAIIQLNINSCSIEELKNHPYFDWNLANSIVNFRHQHGMFSSIDKIKSIHLVVDKIYRKIATYLRIE